MLKILTMNEIENICYPALKAHIQQEVQNWIDEYQIAELDEIGCFVILDANEKELFNSSQMEFVETLQIGDIAYLHGVKMLGDCYGEDTYLPILKGDESNV